jgi:SAM-dependent methyltransferase
MIDQPDLDATRHQHALRGLERINWWSRSARVLWPPIRALAGHHNNLPLRVLDIATGAGDVPIRLWHRAQRSGVKLQLAGCDRSPRAIEYAQARAESGKAGVAFFRADALAGTLPADFDVVTCSLFLHHLDEGLAVDLLRRLAAIARRAVLVNDLVRSRTGYALAWIGTRVLTTSPVVHADGPRSVESAFTLAEALDLAERAGLRGAAVARRWPCRYLLQWHRP